MKPIVYFLIVAIRSDLLLALYVPQDYVVPEPTFEAYSSGGFSVSIPHEEGIELFSFHGNVNEPMNGLNVGQFSKDVLSRKDDRWVYENKVAKLKEGDVIYFWVLIVKDNLGYRYDDGQFVVKDIVEKQPHNNRPHASSSRPTTQSNSDDKTGTPQYSPMCEVALNLSNTVDQLNGDIQMLKEINDVLRKIVAKDEALSRTLRFQGILPPFDDPLYTVQIILQEKLGLHIPVTTATREHDKSITFRVTSLEDKMYVIKAAKEKLENTKSKIILKY